MFLDFLVIHFALHYFTMATFSAVDFSPQIAPSSVIFINDMCTFVHCYCLSYLSCGTLLQKPELMYPIKSVSQHSKCDVELTLNLVLYRVLASG